MSLVVVIRVQVKLLNAFVQTFNRVSVFFVWKYSAFVRVYLLISETEGSYFKHLLQTEMELTMKLGIPKNISWHYCSKSIFVKKNAWLYKKILQNIYSVNFHTTVCQLHWLDRQNAGSKAIAFISYSYKSDAEVMLSSDICIQIYMSCVCHASLSYRMLTIFLFIYFTI